jgi:FixJ family two-component response regulator
VIDGPIDADGEAVAAALALSVDELAESRDVQRVLALSADERRVLAAVLDAGSLRRAGGRLHMHHTTVAYHVERLSERLGFRLLGPEGRTRPVLALAAAQAVESKRRSLVESRARKAVAG